MPHIEWAKLAQKLVPGGFDQDVRPQGPIPMVLLLVNSFVFTAMFWQRLAQDACWDSLRTFGVRGCGVAIRALLHSDAAPLDRLLLAARGVLGVK